MTKLTNLTNLGSKRGFTMTNQMTNLVENDQANLNPNKGGGRENLYPRAGANARDGLMKDVVWVAILKARGFSPRLALELARGRMKEGEGVLFVGATGLLSTVRTEGEKSFPTKVLRTVEGVDPWLTAVAEADRVVILWDRGDGGSHPAVQSALQGKKPLDVVRPNGRTTLYRDGQLVPPDDLTSGVTP